MLSKIPKTSFILKILKPTVAFRSFGHYRYKWEQEQYNLDETEKSRLTHLSNSEELISKVPPIEVDGDVVECKGLYQGFFGHPVQYICTNTRKPHSIVTCNYCGLRYVKKKNKSH